MIEVGSVKEDKQVWPGQNDPYHSESVELSHMHKLETIKKPGFKQKIKKFLFPEKKNKELLNKMDERQNGQNPAHQARIDISNARE